jgi:hypothetical protein
VLKKRNERNEYTCEHLFKNTRQSEPSDFQNFLRLGTTSFDKLLKMITPRIEKKEYYNGDAIPTSQLKFFYEVSTQRFKFFKN